MDVVQLYQHDFSKHSITVSIDGNPAHAICTPRHLIGRAPGMMGVRKFGEAPTSCVPFGAFNIADWRLRQLEQLALPLPAPPSDHSTAPSPSSPLLQD